MQPLKVIAGLALLLALALGAQSLASRGGVALSASRGPIVEQKSVRDIITTDTDGDGISDWEEYLWGTDPRKKDSDQDGILDGIEVAALRANAASSTAPGAPADTETNTDRLAREFFATVAALQADGKLNEATMGSLSEALASRLAALPASGKRYAASELSVIPHSPAAKSRFRQAFGALGRTYAGKGLGNELALLNEALGREDTALLGSIRSYRNEYEALARDLMALPAPEPATAAVVAAANGSLGMAEALRHFELAFEDAAVALSAFVRYVESSSSLEASLIKIGEYLRNEG